MPLVSSSPVHSIGEAGQWGSIPDVLDDRGVAVIEGCAFLGGIGRGIPPEESLTPRVVIRPGFEPLTAKELRAVVHYVAASSNCAWPRNLSGARSRSSSSRPAIALSQRRDSCSRSKCTARFIAALNTVADDLPMPGHRYAAGRVRFSRESES